MLTADWDQTYRALRDLCDELNGRLAGTDIAANITGGLVMVKGSQSRFIDVGVRLEPAGVRYVGKESTAGLDPTWTSTSREAAIAHVLEYLA